MFNRIIYSRAFDHFAVVLFCIWVVSVTLSGVITITNIVMSSSIEFRCTVEDSSKLTAEEMKECENWLSDKKEK
jgi:hypothetical protein